MDEAEGRRSSDVLDAIFARVDAEPEQPDRAATLFRAQALAHLDVAAEVDNQLPLISRRSWLLPAGLGVIVAAFGVWASLTPAVTSVAAPARVIAAPGALPVVAPADGVVSTIDVSPGDDVTAGQPIATIRTAAGEVLVTAATDGTAWQLPVVPGTAVPAGEPLLTLLPDGSARQALVPVPEADAANIRTGMSVDLVAGPIVGGTVQSVSAPISAADAGERLGMVLPAGTAYVIVAAALDEPVAPGTSGRAEIVLAEGTVISRLLGS